MKTNYIELRTRNSFGDIINDYFLFLKYNFKTYINLYLRYNSISIILLLISSYLLATGFLGYASKDFRFGMGSAVDTQSYLIFGGILFLLVYLITALINFSFTSAYMVNYVNDKGVIKPKSIKASISKNLGSIIIFILVGVVFVIAYMIISLVLAFIPFLGTLIQYGFNFVMSAVFGLTFLSIFNNNSFGDALSEGFSLAFSNFWRVVLYGLVIGILNLILIGLVLMIPGVLLGISSYFVIENSGDFTTSPYATIILTIGFALFLLTSIFSQAISQISYGILYYNLNELRHNNFLREKINEIGSND